MAKSKASTSSTVVIGSAHASGVFLGDFPEFKVLQSIVTSIAISVMHSFVGFKEAAKRLFKNEAMFGDVPGFLGERVVPGENHLVAIPLDANLAEIAAAPLVAFGSSGRGCRPMARQPWGWMALELTTPPLSISGYWGDLPASALADSAGDFVHPRDVWASPIPLSANSGIVSLEKFSPYRWCCTTATSTGHELSSTGTTLNPRVSPGGDYHGQI